MNIVSLHLGVQIICLEGFGKNNEHMNLWQQMSLQSFGAFTRRKMPIFSNVQFPLRLFIG